MEYVTIEISSPSVIGTRIYIPARIARQLRGTNDPAFDGKRHYQIRKAQQDVPRELADWLLGDSRYKGFFKSEVTAIVEDASLSLTELSIEVEGEGPDNQALEDLIETVVVDFEAWTRLDIETANLSGDDGLRAYAEYYEIDLEGKTLKADVIDIILEWYDANQYDFD